MKMIFKNKNYKINLLSFLVFVFIVILDINAVDANNFVVAGLNPILGGLKNVLLHMATIVDSLLNYALAYDNFFSVGVNAGWETIRDFANLFFALILLFMSIATVLDIGVLSNYSAKRMLPNFIAIVILINFSKSIVGIFVDISQIIMLEFYNAILSGGGNGLADVIAANTSITAMNNRTWWQTITGVGAQDELFTNLTTIFLVLTMIMTTLWIALSLWVRVVKIWLAIMLSPLAFMAFLLPPIKSVWSQWLSSLQSALVEGPMMLLYIYLGVVILRASGLSTVASGQFDVASYALTIIIFIMARMEAEKAAQQAPAFAKSLVNTVGSVATLGLGKTVGAGGNMNTGDLFKRGKEGIDKGISGTARTLQIASGGKWKLADKYDLAKKNQQEALEEGRGFFGQKKGFGGFVSNFMQQTNKKGKKIRLRAMN